MQYPYCDPYERLEIVTKGANKIRIMDKLQVLVERLKKININIELIGNYPWVYLYKVNGKLVTETLCSETNFTIAFLPIKRGKEIEFTDTKKIFEVIRKLARKVG